LVTLLTGYSPHGLPGLISSRQRSWDSSLRSFLLSQGSRRVSATTEPACRQPRAISYRQNLPAGTRSTGFRAFTPTRVPCPLAGF
jgi:hypothetical protein